MDDFNTPDSPRTTDADVENSGREEIRNARTISGGDGHTVVNIQTAKKNRNSPDNENKPEPIKVAAHISDHINSLDLSEKDVVKVLKRLAKYHHNAVGFSGKSNDSVIAGELVKRCAKLSHLARHPDSGELWSYENGVWSLVDESNTLSLIARELDSLLPEGINDNKVRGVFKMLSHLHGERPKRRAGLIAYRNGVYDAINRKFLNHSPGFGVEGLLPCDYSESTSYPTSFVNFVEMSANGNPERMELMLAQYKYHLENRVHDQIFFENIGDGGCGLSTHQAVLSAMLGDSTVAGIGLDKVDGRDKDKYATTELVGKTAWLISDAAGVVSDFPNLKAITGGDPVPIRDMFKKPYTTILPVTVSVFGNKAMQSTDRSGGLFRRRLVIKLDRVVTESEKDKYLKDRLIQELPSIIAYVQDQMPDDKYYEVIEREKRGHDKMEVMAKTESIVGWIKDCVELTEDEEHRTQIGSLAGWNRMSYKNRLEKARETLFANYLLWCESTGIDRPVKSGFESAFIDAMNLKISSGYRVDKIKTRPTLPEKGRGACVCVVGIRIIQESDHLTEHQKIVDEQETFYPSSC